jgi:uncharacterized membrane protein
MKVIEKSVMINAAVEKGFNYISDPMNQAEWMPSMVSIKDVKGSGLGTSWRWTYKMAGILIEGEGTIAEHIPNKRVVIKSEGGVKSTFTYDFEPHNNGTMLKLTIEYNIPVPVLGKIGEAILLKRNEREADLAMTNIKETLEG